MKSGLKMARRFLGAALLLGLAAWSALNLASLLQPLPPDPYVSLQRKLRFFPWDGDAWFSLGHILSRDLQRTSPPAARRCFETAVSLNPWDYRYWLELARLEEAAGDQGRASECMETALFLNRAYTPLYWQAGNFFLKHGQAARATRCFHQTLRGDPGLLRQVLALSWRFYPDRAKLIQELVPPEPGLISGAMYWCLERRETELAMDCWRRLRAGGKPFELSAAYPLVDHLIGLGRFAEAHRVWREALAATLGLEFRAFRDDVFDGGFELPLSNGGFGWRAAGSPQREFTECPAPRFRGLRSLRIDFDGTENLAGPFLRQSIWLEKPGTYWLEYAILTENLTSDQGVYWRIDSVAAGPPRIELARGPKHLEEGDWRLVSVPFEVPAAGTLIELTCQRDRSRKIDPYLGGRLWLDSISLRREGLTR